MRYVIYGAGAIGGSIGARLFQHGHNVVLICRGAHLEAVQRNGLRFVTPGEDGVLPLAAVAHPSEIDFSADDVVLLTMKSQDTGAALDDLRAAAGDVPVVCAQNGVANERMAARRIARVYGMLVVLGGTHLEPGAVLMHATTVGGVLDAGCFPAGVDPLIEQVCADLTHAGFSANAVPDIMLWKHTKLIQNLGNVIQALCGPEAAAGDIIRELRAEAMACYAAAGIGAPALPELMTRASVITMGQIAGQSRWGGSSWQSLSRGAGSIETDYINGEITLLGALHGIPTPCNRMLQRLAAEAAAAKRPPGAYAVEDLVAMAEGAEAAK